MAVGAGCVLASLLLVNQMSRTEVHRCTIITTKKIDAGHIFSDLSQLERSLIKSGPSIPLSFDCRRSSRHAGGDQLGVVKMYGSFTFSAANGILRKVVPAIQPLKSVIVDLSSVSLMDGDAVLAIEQLAQK